MRRRLDCLAVSLPAQVRLNALPPAFLSQQTQEIDGIVGAALARMRTGFALSLEQMANLMNVPVAELEAYEAGTFTAPAEILSTACKVVGVSHVAFHGLMREIAKTSRRCLN